MNATHTVHTALALTAALALGACAPMQPGAGIQQQPKTMATLPVQQQSMLPAAVQVPPGNQVAMETVGSGTITYACKAKKDNAAAYEWTFMGPDAQLNDRNGQRVGRYFGPPATWESTDGSKVTATQLAVAPAGAGNIPMQLVRANPAMGQGAMQGVTYIQRVMVKGGAAPTAPCSAATAGQQQIVNYQADYIFWRAAPAGSVQGNPLYSRS